MKPTLLALLLAAAATAAHAVTPRSSVVINDTSSGYSPSYYVSPQPRIPEIHILGLYESISGASATGTANVHVLGSAAQPVHLVVSSYEATRWVFDGPGVASISSVLINGADPGEVVGVPSSKVVDRTGPNWLGMYGYAWPSASGGSNTPLLVQTVQSLLGGPISTFSGIYRSTDFTVNLVSVPEPASWWSAAVAGAALQRARRKKSR